jgi:hypothetical protein
VLDWIIETLSLGLFLVSLAGLAALIKPYWKFKRRWRGAAGYWQLNLMSPQRASPLPKFRRLGSRRSILRRRGLGRCEGFCG